MRYARFKPTPNGLLDDSVMEVRGEMIPACESFADRYEVLFTAGLFPGCVSVVDAADIEFIEPEEVAE